MKTKAHSKFFETERDGEKLSSYDFARLARYVFEKTDSQPAPLAEMIHDYTVALKTIVQLEMVAEMKKSVEKIQFFL